MRAISIASLCAIAFAANGAFADTVFKSVDESGQVIYSDRPSVGGQNESLEIDIRRSNAQTVVVKKSADEQIAAAAAIRENHEAEDAASEAQMAAEVAERRQSNCTAAKSRQEKYVTNRKLYKPLANGEREYLSDDELDAARADAARTVEEWCS